ncbi:MAG: hypothetical protein M1836_003129 [Candelina mexicana]|nr:MAG: hypothetical protein M1836_003129 [Candelina mexicana]
MEYLIRLVQVHETFRKPEIQALAILAEVDLEFLAYSELSPYCIIRLPNEAAARALIQRSILSKGIYELWGCGITHPELHEDVQRRTESRWIHYSQTTFKFEVDAFQGKRSAFEQQQLIESFKYMGFRGPIKMRNPEQEFCVFEHYSFKNDPVPSKVYLGRRIAGSARDILNTYDLKKRKYISTTSMDSELALVTANLTLAAQHKIFYDPFVGTGSFPIACSHFGAMALGSDIDGRSVRGKEKRNILTNFEQYGLVDMFVDSFISDLTHTPLRQSMLFDGIVCDPPYGVREGLKVLGSRDGLGKELVIIDGQPAHLRAGYLPPKRPYGFEAMLDDILEFAAAHLVPEGRLSLWMPTANDADGELVVPSHPCLELISACVQAFNKWSRRLLTYRRLPDALVVVEARDQKRGDQVGIRADDLNAFRRRYFEGFKSNANGKENQKP